MTPRNVKVQHFLLHNFNNTAHHTPNPESVKNSSQNNIRLDIKLLSEYFQRRWEAHLDAISQAQARGTHFDATTLGRNNQET